MGWISVAFSPDGNSIATASGKLDQSSPDNQAGRGQDSEFIGRASSIEYRFGIPVL